MWLQTLALQTFKPMKQLSSQFESGQRDRDEKGVFFSLIFFPSLSLSLSFSACVLSLIFFPFSFFFLFVVFFSLCLSKMPLFFF